MRAQEILYQAKRDDGKFHIKPSAMTKLQDSF